MLWMCEVLLTVLYALYRTILYYTVLHYTASYYTVLLHSVDNCTTILLYYYATTCIQLDMHLHDHTTPLNTPAHNYGTYCTCTAAPNTREHARHHAVNSFIITRLGLGRGGVATRPPGRRPRPPP